MIEAVPSCAQRVAKPTQVQESWDAAKPQSRMQLRASLDIFRKLPGVPESKVIEYLRQKNIQLNNRTLSGFRGLATQYPEFKNPKLAYKTPLAFLPSFPHCTSGWNEFGLREI